MLARLRTMALFAALGACAPETDLLSTHRDAGVSPTSNSAAGTSGTTNPSSTPPSAVPPPDPAKPDTEPPAFANVIIGLAADCVRVRVDLDEPATARIVFRADGGTSEDAMLGAGGSRFDIALRLAHLLPGSDVMAIVSATDAAGNQADSSPVALHAPPARSPLVISELMVNPAGPETTQEYVELHNQGSTPLSLAGFTIDDEGGADPLPAVTLAPDQRALVVGANFDDQSAADTPPRAGTPLLRVPGRIGRDGLRQSGESVRLLGPDGAVVSSYGGWINATAMVWSGRSVVRSPDEGACDHPSAWSTAPQPPTPGW